jgi:hypothetical protein
MATITARKSDRHNQLEGLALSAVFKFLPLFLMLAWLLKHRSGIPFFSQPGVALMLAVAASVSYPWLQQVLELKFPRAFRGACEPSFYDASLSVPQKLQGWVTNRRSLREIAGNAIAIVLVLILVSKTGGF